MSIRMLRLLDADRKESARLAPLQQSLALRLNALSTAEVTIPRDAPAVAARQLMELYDEKGSAGFFRVTEVREDVGNTRSISLEHSLCTLRDSMVGSFACTCTVREALTQLLAFQQEPLWSPGEVELPEDTTIIFAVSYTDLLTALQNLLSMLPEGYALDFDQSGEPWLLHLRHLTEDDPCEGRLSRNLHSVRVETDASRLCTRVYPFGAEVELQHISLVPLEGVDYLCSDAEAAWGVISRTFQSDLIFDVPTLKSVAEMYLARHAQPEVTITVSGVDLHAVTGEDIDSFRLGRMCRLALPDMGMTLCQRITAIERPDVYGAPGQVTLTLSAGTQHQSEEAEIEEMVRRVTTGKLLGGTVTEVVSENYAYGSFPSPIVHYFDIEDWAAVLDVRVTFSPDAGVSIRDLRIDSIHPADEEWRGGSISAMPYLTRDELGQIARGQHLIQISPSNGVYGEDCGVRSVVTMTVIEKTSA